MPKLEISLDPEEVDAFLEGERTVRVATVDADGRPHVVPLWFVWVDGTLFVNTTEGNRSVRNLGASPQAAATIDDGQTYDDLRGVVLRGPLTRAEGDPRLAAVREAFSRKYYGGNPPPFDGWRGRVFLRLEPEEVVSWDFRKIPAARARRRAEREASA